MPEIIVSEQHKKAVALNQKIIVSAELAQKNLWDMCVSLKTMRDDKLYKELGYENFEGYCENEVGIKRSQAYKYISISEKVSSNFVHSSGQIGVQKLSLLATISEQEQKEVAEKVNLEDTTVKELKAEIDRIKSEKSRLESKIDSINTDLLQQMGINRLKDKDLEKLKSEMNSVNNQLLQQRELNYLKDNDLEKLKKSAKEKDKLINGLKLQVEELENRPIEVAVVEPSENEQKLRAELESLKAEKQEEIDNLSYELAKTRLQKEPKPEDIEYKAAYKNAENALKALQSVIEKYNIKPGEAIGLCDTFIFIVKGL